MSDIQNQPMGDTAGQIPPLSDAIIHRVTAHRSDALRGVVKTDPAKLARDYLDLNRSRELFQRLAAYLPVKGGNILEVGSGFGPFVAYVSRWGGLTAYGMEPNPQSVQVCRDVQQEVGTPADHVLRAVGETTPFASNSMDLVVSFTVFEHVLDPMAVLRESVRVLRPGGHLYFTFPNYGSWWEGHYAILWIPHIPKPLARVYLRLLGRNPDFVNHLQLIDYQRLSGMVETLGDQVEVIDYGGKIWEDRLRTIGIENYAQLGKLKNWVKILHKLRLVELVIRLGRKAHWETPFVLILKKK
ncbi:MAG: class I SAM-dependent methyltransferase [Anaerolinea sp.]|nr:class I SAM-dependent methyltransferase [Anaerolinea sp.]